MTAYEFIICNNPGNVLVRENNRLGKAAEPEELRIVVNENTGDVTCNCSGNIMKRNNKKFPAMESDYHCDMCGKDVTVVWD